METRTPGGLTAQDWFRRFQALYNSSAGSLLTEMGLFYDRHRKFEEYAQQSDPDHPEYTNAEWSRVLASVLAELAGSFGLVQEYSRDGAAQLEWYFPGVPDRPIVVIRETAEATNLILSHDLSELAQLGSPFTVFLMYPDYPLPPGTSTIEEAIRTWRGSLEQRLTELRPAGEVLALMISAYSFDLPAPWSGFVWRPAAHSLAPTS